jgi:pimeloyl-ACP methyl ester carboxylesterase
MRMYRASGYTFGMDSDQYLETSFGRMRFVEAGRGEPIVLVHGIGRSLHDWSENIDVLAQSHRVIALDMLGFGRSDKPKIRYTVDLQAQVLCEFMRGLKLEPATLIGNSLGGAVSLTLALRHPEMLSHLVLVAPAGMGEHGAAFFGLMARPLIGELITRPSLAGSKRFLHALFADKKFHTEARAKQDFELGRTPGSQRVFLSMLRSMVQRQQLHPELLKNLRDRLHELELPTLMIWGEQDQILFSRYAAAAAAMLKNGRLEIFDPCGHFPMIECADAFNKLVLEFLDTKS